MLTRVRLGALVAVLGLAASGCANQDNLPQTVLDPEGPVSRQLDKLWDPVFLIAAIIFFLVELGVLFVVFRFRERTGDEQPRQVHGNTALELTWTAIPALILAVIGVFTVLTVLDINRRAEGAEVLQVKVIGNQWWWEYEYPDQEVVTANELVIPTGSRVELEMTSADVIHSFWPPKLAGKVDVVPGRINRMQLEAEEAGTYYGQCGEFCGLSHAYMRLRVIAMEPADFEEWVEGQQQEASAAPSSDEAAAEGEALFTAKGCGGCHTVNGLEGAGGKVGPDLTHVASRKTFAGAIFDFNDVNLRKWLRDPPGQKPMDPDNGQGMPNLGLSEEEITQLIAYLKTLK